MLPPILILGALGGTFALVRSRSRKTEPEPDPAELAREVIADPRTSVAGLIELAALVRERRPDVAAMLERAAQERQAPSSGAAEAPTPVRLSTDPAPGIDPRRGAVARLMGEWRTAGANDLAVIALQPALLCDVRLALGLPEGDRSSERYSAELALACQEIDPEAPAGHPIVPGDPLDAARQACQVQP